MEEKRNFCVYQHTNKINNKKYIGITSQRPEKRWNKGNGYKHHQQLFYNAIQKYGWDNFDHIILFKNITETEAKKLEFKIINELKSNTREFGYNIENGGGVPPNSTKQILSYDFRTGIYLNEFQSLTECANYYKLSTGQVCDVCNGKNRQAKGLCFLYKDNFQYIPKAYTTIEYKSNFHCKAVLCWKADTLDYIGKFKSLREAGRILNIQSGISAVCKHKLRQIKGYIFRYEGDTVSLKEIMKKQRVPINKKKCICINTKEIFNSISEASHKYNIAISSISNVCNGKHKSAGKDFYNNPLYWMYYDDYSNMSINDKNNYIFIHKSNRGLHNKKNIICLNNNEVFDFMCHAAIKYNTQVSSICNCCKHKAHCKSAGKLPDGTKLHWMYLDEYMKQNGYTDISQIPYAIIHNNDQLAS